MTMKGDDVRKNDRRSEYRGNEGRNGWSSEVRQRMLRTKKWERISG